MERQNIWRACALLSIIVIAVPTRLAKGDDSNDNFDMDSCQISSEPIQVLLLTYHRSGSSYVGELLAAQHNSSYYFEPLFYSDYVLRDRSPEGRRNFLQQIMNCEPTMLEDLRTQTQIEILRKFLNRWNHYEPTDYSQESVSRYCQCSPVRIIKTIRLRLTDAIPMLDTVPGLRIINLVRDPRARYASAVAPGGYWSPVERSLDMICSDMAADLEAARDPQLNEANYMRIRYEDVVNDPTNQVRAIYRRFLGEDTAEEQLLNYHTNGTGPGDYYSTYRLPGFDPNHWKDTLNRTIVEQIQAQCGSVIKELGYDLMYQY